MQLYLAVTSSSLINTKGTSLVYQAACSCRVRIYCVSPSAHVDLISYKVNHGNNINLQELCTEENLLLEK